MRKPERIVKLEEVIAKAANISIDDLTSDSRSPAIAEARQVLWTVAYDEMSYSYPMLASYYQKDHTTIIHGVSKMRNSDACSRFIEAIKKNSPGLFDLAPTFGEAKTLESWKF